MLMLNMPLNSKALVEPKAFQALPHTGPELPLWRRPKLLVAVKQGCNSWSYPLGAHCMAALIQINHNCPGWACSV